MLAVWEYDLLFLKQIVSSIVRGKNIEMFVIKDSWKQWCYNSG